MKKKKKEKTMKKFCEDRTLYSCAKKQISQKPADCYLKATLFWLSSQHGKLFDFDFCLKKSLITI